jgi:hypothetical protein
METVTSSPMHQLRLPLGPDAPAPAERPVAPSNEDVARALAEVGELLAARGANPFRVRAYRNAADSVRRLARPLAAILEGEDLAGLERVPGIGRSLARSIERMVRTGRLPVLERLRSQSTPERLFATIPDLGPQLARRIHEQLGVSTLAELERAAWDGRLGAVPGMGPKRLAAVRESLAGRLRGRSGPRPAQSEPGDAPPVAELLDVDREYRLLAEANRLPRIAPRRFNPTEEAWLPVLRTQRGDRLYSAAYCNTARAHELGTLRDWVVILVRRAGARGRFTVITGSYGRLAGRRIVLGRAAECAEHYGVSRRPRKPKPR